MSFFENQKVANLLERNIRRIAGIEDTQAAVLMKQFMKARKVIREQLSRTLSGTFTEAQLSSTLVQIESVIQSLNQRLDAELMLGVQMASEQGVEDLVKEVNTFEKMFTGVTQGLPLDAILGSLRPKNYLINQYKSSMDLYSKEVRAKIQQALTQAVIIKKPVSRVLGDIEQILASEEWKLHRIVRTELHHIYNNSKFNGLIHVRDEYVPDMMKSLFHPMDHRTGDDSKQVAQMNLIIPINKPFKYKVQVGKKVYEREYMAPPSRPNDRGILIPYRREWNVSRTT